MNIPDDAFFALLTRGIQLRGDATLQRALYQTLREAILQGELLSHSRLPGARVIAQRAGVSRNTVNSALEQLAIEGYLNRSRQGTYVAALNMLAESEPTPPTFVLPERLRTLPQPGRRDSPALLLTTGMPAVNYFPLAIWRRLLDRVLRENSSTILGYGEAAGEPALREAIARHLTLSRGIRCTARQIVITEGALEGVNLCTHLLSEAGDTAWVEEPGYFGAKSVFIKAGLQIKGIAVDSDGMRPDIADEPPPRLIFTSPSHQYPSGAVMSAGRRLALLEYARQHNVWIIEDDYDSEFRYSGEPIQAMLGMVTQAPVVYLGTFSKTLFPSLRIGFAVMPPALAEAAQEAIGALLRGGHRLEQRALALFIEEGHYARHLASMRRLYRRRQQLLREAVASEFELANEIWGGEGGLHLTVAIDGIDDVQIVELARRYQMAPAALSRFYLNPQTARSGLVLGYGNTSAAHFVASLRTLNRLIRQQRGSG